jgi:hypothetical protein
MPLLRACPPLSLWFDPRILRWQLDPARESFHASSFDLDFSTSSVRVLQCTTRTMARGCCSSLPQTSLPPRRARRPDVEEGELCCHAAGGCVGHTHIVPLPPPPHYLPHCPCPLSPSSPPPSCHSPTARCSAPVVGMACVGAWAREPESHVGLFVLLGKHQGWRNGEALEDSVAFPVARCAEKKAKPNFRSRSRFSQDLLRTVWRKWEGTGS